MADPASSLNLSQILGAGSSLAGLGLGAASQGQQTGILQNALSTIGPTQLQGYNLTGPGGMSAGYNPNGGASIGLGSLSPAFASLVNGGAGGASAYSPDLLSGLTSSAASTLNPALSNLSSAYGGNNLFQNLAATQAGSLGQTYNSVYGNTLNSLQAIQAPQVQQQAFGLQNTLFGNGTLNSSGAASGANAAANFGRDVNSMNAQDALTAQQQALGAMSNQAGISSTLSNTGNSLLSNAFANFGNTNQLISGLNTAQLNNSISALQGAGALNTLGLNNYMAALQTGSAQANAKNLSLFPYAGVATSLAGTPTPTGMLAGGLSTIGNSLLGPNGLLGLFGGGGNNGGTSGSGGSSILSDASAGGQAAGTALGGAGAGLAASGAFGTDAIASGALANSALAGAGFGGTTAGGAAGAAAGSSAAGSTAGAGAGSSGALGSVALPLAAAALPLILGLSTPAVSMGANYYPGLMSAVQNGTPGSAAYQNALTEMQADPNLPAQYRAQLNAMGLQTFGQMPGLVGGADTYSPGVQQF